jgi:two-component system, OmpR family, KDP operon response regulator KdpE
MADVLVVEDEANVRKLVSVNLSSRGHQLFEAENGAQALVLLQAHPPALMVLDIKLPDFTGWELLEQVSRDPAIKLDFPVLVITASITDAYVDLAPYPWVVEILIKPFSTSRLLAAVESALEPVEKRRPTNGPYPRRG